MSTLFDFLGIVMLVFGVLQIILFFKMWRMTDDIKELKDRVDTQCSEIKEISKLYLLCNYANLEQALYNKLYSDLKLKLTDAKSNDNKDVVIDQIKYQYKRVYTKYGIPFPEKVEALKTFDDFNNL